MSDELQQSLTDFRRQLASIRDEQELYALQVAFLGKRGTITALRTNLGALPPDARKAFGQAFNEVKRCIEVELEVRRKQLAEGTRARDLERTDDLTTMPRRPPLGTLHIITRTRRALEQTFLRMGFDIVDGPHVEHERFNFDDLNFGTDHPARDMQDTFFVARREGTSPADPSDGRDLVLRTHTSPLQIRSMLARKPPLRIAALGTTFRRDDDATHSPMFHQIEGLRVDAGVSMADLKATLYRFVSALFGTHLEVRFRPSYFPFVEPGAEFDMQCPFCRSKAAACAVCKRSGWIELGGAGMVHPAVLEAVGYDPERVSGWAFGFGIDRMAALQHGVHDLRLMFEGDVRFLEQFPC